MIWQFGDLEMGAERLKIWECEDGREFEDNRFTNKKPRIQMQGFLFVTYYFSIVYFLNTPKGSSFF